MEQLRKIPKVDRVLESEEVKGLLAEYPRTVVLRAARLVLEQLRKGVLAGEASEDAFSAGAIGSEIGAEIARLIAPSLRKVVNGTGVVVHTNLGRSILPERARQALNEVAFSYSNLEFDLEKNRRGSRYDHVERLICELTGAEAALVVNNNAAAVLLALGSAAAGREAIVSRGELVEIGGSFRIPDVMRLSGVTLTEVGTTNRTHAKDYRAAVTTETALFLKVHTSNFAVVGFTAEVGIEEMVRLGKETGVPVMADMGSGSLIDLRKHLPCDEPNVQEFVQAGVDIITFSGDKLLGGPQAGIIVGKKAFIEPMKKHPLLRAVRIDKLTLASLEATLGLYRDERVALKEVPTLAMLTAPLEEVTRRAKGIVRQLRRALPASVHLSLIHGESQGGGGTLPLLNLPTLLIEVAVDGLSPNELEAALRTSEIPVIGRIWKGSYVLDPRTLLEEDVAYLAAALGATARAGSRE
ncbi:L-seryl-tRNA(Sec) selenium transferase [Geomonas sp. RF6]|uniref:L-seryl-tRNA(Sec) selenium transferase n=1 Tax=Geomonas sp. RF6 TaxID=2897342 RepID=UPI001E614150|nr:L-seryl-tRNA(Sec) selenium transferase [Geomonas sp. RF6]UFS72049.1 L-seryl-tRNA(Sec) selenium transferase [Geomonas sp. RF6]